MGFAPFTHIIQAIFALTYNQVRTLQNNKKVERPNEMMTGKLFYIEMEALSALSDTIGKTSGVLARKDVFSIVKTPTTFHMDQ
jgi:hypothetical protein